MALLEISGIDVFYGRVQAVRGASLEVDTGEVVALIAMTLTQAKAALTQTRIDPCASRS